MHWGACVIIIVTAASFLSIDLLSRCPGLASLKLSIGLMIRAEWLSQHLGETAAIPYVGPY